MGALSSPAAAADVSYIDMFRNRSFAQTSDSAASPSGAFFSTTVFAASPGVFEAGAFTPPLASSPTPLTASVSSDFGYASVLLPDQATMDASFPTGTYLYSLSPVGGGGPTTLALTYAADLYPDSTPFLTGSSFSALHVAPVAAPIMLTINPVLNSGAPDSAFVFLVIRDGSDDIRFNAGFLPAATTAITVPGGTLLPATAYSFELIYSNRVLLPNDGTTDFRDQIGFDYRTSGGFTTAAVPEPSTWALMLSGVVALAWRRRWRDADR